MTDRVTTLAERFVQLPVISSALERLRAELPPTLLCHSYAHTLDVYEEALTFGVSDGLLDRELELLAVGAAFHDTGFIVRSYANEPFAATYAKEALASSGHYQPEEIELVAQMVLDTAIQTTQTGRIQIPTTSLSRYLLDADLSNFGRQDFFEKGELQRQESQCDKATFLVDTLNLLKNQSWLTPAAERLRGAQKALNVAALEKLVNAT